MDATPGCNLPGTVEFDRRLVIRGNILYNGPPSLPTGARQDGGCLDTNPTCREGQLLRDNYVNTLRPELDALGRPTVPAGQPGSLAGLPKLVRPLPPFWLWEAGPGVPQGTLANAVPRDRDARFRLAGRDAPGAYVAPPAAPPA